MNYQTKLIKMYNKIMNLNILTNITDENLKLLEKILNSCLPKNTEEKTIYYFVKELYYNNKEQFVSYIMNTNNIHLILLTDNKNMMNHFNLNEKIFIGWNNEYKKYYVSKYVKKELLIDTESANHEYYQSTTVDDIVYDIVDNIQL